MSKAWKAFEREVAEFFDGQRIIRVSRDEVKGDILHPIYSIECKWGSQVPKHLAPGVPTILTVGERRFKLVPTQFLVYDDGRLYVTALCWFSERRQRSQFLSHATAQAQGYNPTLKPLVCVKPRRYRGFVCIWEEK